MDAKRGSQTQVAHATLLLVCGVCVCDFCGMGVLQCMCIYVVDVWFVCWVYMYYIYVCGVCVCIYGVFFGDKCVCHVCVYVCLWCKCIVCVVGVCDEYGVCVCVCSAGS